AGDAGFVAAHLAERAVGVGEATDARVLGLVAVHADATVGNAAVVGGAVVVVLAAGDARGVLAIGGEAAVVLRRQTGHAHVARRIAVLQIRIAAVAVVDALDAHPGVDFARAAVAAAVIHRAAGAAFVGVGVAQLTVGAVAGSDAADALVRLRI